MVLRLPLLLETCTGLFVAEETHRVSDNINACLGFSQELTRSFQWLRAAAQDTTQRLRMLRVSQVCYLKRGLAMTSLQLRSKDDAMTIRLPDLFLRESYLGQAGTSTATTH